MTKIFDLTFKERTILYDLYVEATGRLSTDIIEYIQSKEIVKMTL